MYISPTSFERIAVGDTGAFEVGVGLHQGSALSQLLFIIVMEEVTKHIKQGLPWEMFADDLVLLANTEDELRTKLLLWKVTLEQKGFKVNILTKQRLWYVSEKRM